MVVSVLNLCRGTSIVRYYEALQGNNKGSNIAERQSRVATSESSMLSHYRNLVDIASKPMIYSSYMNAQRQTITRWRLSNHRLQIELGRYNNIPWEEWKCTRCSTVEDEYHAISVCPTIHHLRVKYIDILTKYNSVCAMLNPECGDMYENF